MLVAALSYARCGFIVRSLRPNSAVDSARLSARFFRLQTCSQSGTEKGLGLLKKRFVIY
ncbi:hypothetical protein BACCOPRO_00179 [Phocaeicola coprophilus DSM 18228 = JCM 13818]|uniref:Uncharacterized protein n=1 Tax=Phocaeicola coprophilus DSM 18228 = JCM 13818 TaxID=547042 RepID=S0F841_9BACT|nr:hypothetical protein BACCOPRO_00179 [Phocaeicola coprophilus DSM 18228 = JCM 13818]